MRNPKTEAEWDAWMKMKKEGTAGPEPKKKPKTKPPVNEDDWEDWMRRQNG